MKLLLVDHNSVFEELKKEFEVVDYVHDADAVVLWNDVNPFERSVIELAHAMKKKVFVMQHGRKGSSRYYPPFNEPITADKIMVWSEFDRRRLISAGQDPKKIEVVGSPILKNLPKKTEPTGTSTIVFCPEHWDRPVEENLKIRDELRKVHGKKYNVLTKLIESHDPTLFDNPVQTFRGMEGHLDKCKEVLSSCKLVIGVSESTFELMAQAMDIPVIIVEDWEPKSFGGDERYTQYPRLISQASHRTTVKNLLETIEYVLANPDELKTQRLIVAESEGGKSLDTVNLIKRCLKT